MLGIGAGSSFYLSKSLSDVSFSFKCKKRWDLRKRPGPSKITSWYSWVNRTKEITNSLLYRILFPLYVMRRGYSCECLNMIRT